jgi:hypothetical protein
LTVAVVGQREQKRCRLPGQKRAATKRQVAEKIHRQALNMTERAGTVVYYRVGPKVQPETDTIQVSMQFRIEIGRDVEYDAVPGHVAPVRESQLEIAARVVQGANFVLHPRDTAQRPSRDLSGEIEHCVQAIC